MRARLVWAPGYHSFPKWAMLLFKTKCLSLHLLVYQSCHLNYGTLNVSPRVRESGFRNSGIFTCEIQNPGNVCLWIPESWALECGIQIVESGISLMIGIRNPSLNDEESGIQNPRIQDCLGFPYLGRNVSSTDSCRLFLSNVSVFGLYEVSDSTLTNVLIYAVALLWKLGLKNGYRWCTTL